MIYFIKHRSLLFGSTDMFSKSYRIVIIATIIFGFISCQDETGESSGPSITFIQGNEVINNDTIITPGQLMTFGIEAIKGDYNLTEFFIRVKGDSVLVYFDTGVNMPDLKWTGSFVKSFNEHETWEFIVRDRYSKSASVFLEIQADTISGFDAILNFTDLILGAQNNVDPGPCMDTRTGQNYLLPEAMNNQEFIDLVCYYFGEDENVIASSGANIENEVFPENLSPIYWPIRNTTRFIKLLMDETAFNQIQNDSTLIANYIEGEGKRKAKNLIPGDIYSFKTQDSRIGILKINEVIGQGDGQIVFDVKIQHTN